MLIGYARVSTREQDTALQRDALRRARVRVVHEDKASGVSHRPALEALLKALQPGDVLVVYKVDRLARSLSDLLSILRRIDAARAEFRSLTEPIDTTTPAGRLMLQLLGAFAEFERTLIRERSMAGLVAARERGVRLGRPEALSARQRASVVRMFARGVTRAEVARRFSVHASTVTRVLREARREAG